MTILVTGRMGAGKSQVLDLISMKSYPTCQADELAKALFEPNSPCFEDLIQILGVEFLSKEGQIRQNLLIQKLFKDPFKLKAVEELLHPWVQKAFSDFLKRQQDDSQEFVFYEMPLLSKSSIQGRFDQIILVRSFEHISLQRLQTKGFKKEDIYVRWNLQAKDEDVLDITHFVIWNNSNIHCLAKQVEPILQQITKRCI